MDSYTELVEVSAIDLKNSLYRLNYNKKTL